jgi:hypothetical protein
MHASKHAHHHMHTTLHSQTSGGIPTSVTFGFMRSLMALLQEEQPQGLVVIFDAPGPSFRHHMLAGYKQSRLRPPPEFPPDLANLQTLLHFLRVPTLAVPGFEADDVSWVCGWGGLSLEVGGWAEVCLGASTSLPGRPLWATARCFEGATVAGVSRLPPSA